MLILIYVVTIALSLFIKNRKQNWIIYAMVLCLLLWTSDGTYADFKGYYNIFEKINTSGINLVGATPGWFLLCRLFGMIGLNYYGMSIALAFISCLLLHIFFLKFDANENVIWATLLIFPLLINGIQVRFFFTMSIVTYGLNFLIFNHKFSWLKYCACVLIATSVHSAAAIFVILVLVTIYEKLNLRQSVLVTMLLFALTVIGVQMIPKLAKAYLYQSQYDRYIANSYTTTSVKWAFAIVICWLVTLLLFKMLGYITTAEVRQEYIKLKYDIVLKRVHTILLLLGLTLPLLIYDRNFHRFIQLGYILDAIVLGICWKHIGRNDDKIEKFSAYIIFIILLLPAIYSYEFIPVNATAPLFKIIGFPSILR